MYVHMYTYIELSSSNRVTVLARVDFLTYSSSYSVKNEQRNKLYNIHYFTHMYPYTHISTSPTHQIHRPHMLTCYKYLVNSKKINSYKLKI